VGIPDAVHHLQAGVDRVMGMAVDKARKQRVAGDVDDAVLVARIAALPVTRPVGLDGSDPSIVPDHDVEVLARLVADPVDDARIGENDAHSVPPSL
jgi:hypothetical protein